MTIFTSLKEWFRKPSARFSVPELPGFTLPLPVLGLWYIGLWPIGRTGVTKIYAYLTTFIIAYTVLGETLYVVEIWGSMVQMFSPISTILAGLRVIFVCIYLLWEEKQLIYIIKKFVAEIWISREHDEKDYLDTEKGMTLGLLNFLSLSIVVAMTLFTTLPYINSRNLLGKDKEFPFKILYPYSYTHNLVAYNLVYLQCFHAGWSCATLLFAHDILLNYMLVYTCTRIKRLHSQIVNIGDKITGRVEDDRAVDKALAEAVEQHNRIIEFVEEIEDLFSPLILLQFMQTSFLTCVLGIEILYAPESPLDILKLGLFFISSVGQLFSLCFSGQRLIDWSSEVGDAAYQFNWIDINRKFHMNIIMIMQRSQRPLQVTAYKFTNLSMESFSAICRAAGSYFTMLNQFMEEAEV